MHLEDWYGLRALCVGGSECVWGYGFLESCVGLDGVCVYSGFCFGVFRMQDSHVFGDDACFWGSMYFRYLRVCLGYLPTPYEKWAFSLPPRSPTWVCLGPSL